MVEIFWRKRIFTPENDYTKLKWIKIKIIINIKWLRKLTSSNIFFSAQLNENPRTENCSPRILDGP